MLNTEPLVVLVTIPTGEEAQVLSNLLLEKKLIACCNIVPQVVSLYRWQGKIEQDREVLMIMKSRAEVFDELLEIIREKHPYTVPEIIALPIVRGNPDYLNWLKEEIKNTGSE